MKEKKSIESRKNTVWPHLSSQTKYPGFGKTSSLVHITTPYRTERKAREESMVTG